MLRKFFDDTRRTQKNVIEAAEKGMTGIGLLYTTVDDVLEDGEADDEDLSSMSSSDSKFRIVQCGKFGSG